MGAKPYKSAAWLRLRYITERKSITDMAKEAGVTEMTIRRALEANGIIKK